MIRLALFSPFTFHFIFPALLGFYSFYSILFARYLKRKDFVRLIVSGVLVPLICGNLGVWLPSLLYGGAGWDPHNDWTARIAIILFISMLALVHGMIGMVMRGFIAWYGDIRSKEELNRRNYEMELALVKSQINPHFLFNTINNIDVLIEKDPPTASRYLNKLSDILRFMLYEAKTDKIPLVKELTYIEKYIDLQRIRTANPDYVDYSFTGVADHIMIEPMLFIPFIENAFKHAENKKLENTIHIRVAAGDHELSFACENKFNDPGPGRSVRAGLGNELIQRRLNLLYPGKHRLEIRVGEQTYKVKLSIYHEGH